MSIADEIYMSTENPEPKTVKKSNRYNCDHNDAGVSNIRLYREIKASLIRTKNAMIDDVLSPDSSELHLDDILQLVAEVVDSYERLRLIYKYYIFEGNIPEDLLPSDEELDDDEIAEQDFMNDEDEDEDDKTES